MKRYLFLLLAVIASTQAYAEFSLLINNPQFQWQKKTQGFITNPDLVITPRGVYAEMEFTFTINCQNNYNVKDTLEAVLNFELPANSFVHDSWLWLDANTIIQADIMERGRGIAIYEGIVRRRRDPSLLVKTGENSYSLSVFPLTTAYPRQVKIVYSVPFNWLTDRVNIPLPTGILNTSLVKPPLTVHVRNDANYIQPSFTEQAYGSFVTSTSTGLDNLSIPYTAYEEDLTLNYQPVMNNGTLLYTFPTNINEGIYQLVVNPANVLGQAAAKNFVIILDHDNIGINTIYDFDKVKNYVHSLLRNNANPTDSFNIFYVDATNVVRQTSAGWSAADAASVSTAFNSLPNAINSNNKLKYEELLKAALAFCKTKPGNAAQAILISNSTTLNNQTLADTTFNRINAFLGGFTNKVHIINNSAQAQWSGGVTHIGNELFYSKLAITSGGSFYKYTSSVYVNSKYQYTLDVKNILEQTYRQAGTNLSSFGITLPLSGGFIYSMYDVTRLNRFSTSTPYVETGKFVGSIGSGNVDVALLTGSGLVSAQLPLSSVAAGWDHSRKAWNYLYIDEMKGMNGMGSYTVEMIDSSIRNRVLCDLTVFLAIETGDTIYASANELDVEEIKQVSLVTKCYPNPFIDQLTIEFATDVEELIIMDMSGRVVFSHKPGTERKFVWNGRNTAGNQVPAGVYVIKAKTRSSIQTLKVIRQ